MLLNYCNPTKPLHPSLKTNHFPSKNLPKTQQFQTFSSTLFQKSLLLSQINFFFFFIWSAMPGTIRVSVLEFMDLPKLSPSPLSIKISLGRRHFEAWDKGEFLFPLTTLRDDVILIIQDIEGNEISRAGVQAKSIVEKGYWDDLFPLQGGGQVHLQFQFSLSDDDRSRVRMMRETVLKRKHAELQDRSLKSSGSNLATSINPNPEISDSQKSLLQIGDDLSSKEAAYQSPTASTENLPDNEKLVTENTNAIGFDQMQQLSVENDTERDEDNSSTISLLQEADVNQPKVNDTQKDEDISSTVSLLHEADVYQPKMNDTEKDEDISSTVSLLQEADVNQPKVDTELLGTIETRSPDDNNNKPSKTIHSVENLLPSQGLEFFSTPEKSEDKTLNSEETPPSRAKTPSNVKKVISAFESSLTQDTRPRIKPSLRNTQYSLKEKQKKVTEENTKTAVSETMLNPPFEREVKHDLAYVKTEEEKSNFIEALDGSKLPEDPKQSLTLKETKPETGGENLSENDEFGKEHKEVDAKNDDESYQKLMSRTNQETETVSERMMDGYSTAQQPTESTAEKPEFHRNSVVEESEMQKPSRNSQEIDIQGTSVSEVTSVSCIKNEQFPSKSYGGWIFPDERRRLCVTTGDNQVLDPVGGRISNTFMRKDDMKISMEENGEATEPEANESRHNHQKMIKPESSGNANSSEGPLANALKIAIMIGFGTLVLFTRQRRKKK